MSEEKEGIKVVGRYITDVGEMSEEEFANFWPQKNPISLRDRFAMAALTGMLSNVNGLTGKDILEIKDGFANAAYEIADAMLAAAPSPQEGK